MTEINNDRYYEISVFVAPHVGDYYDLTYGPSGELIIFDKDVIPEKFYNYADALKKLKDVALYLKHPLFKDPEDYFKIVNATLYEKNQNSTKVIERIAFFKNSELKMDRKILLEALTELIKNVYSYQEKLNSELDSAREVLKKINGGTL